MYQSALAELSNLRSRGWPQPPFTAGSEFSGLSGQFSELARPHLLGLLLCLVSRQMAWQLSDPGCLRAQSDGAPRLACGKTPSVERGRAPARMLCRCSGAQIPGVGRLRFWTGEAAPSPCTGQDEWGQLRPVCMLPVLREAASCTPARLLTRLLHPTPRCSVTSAPWRARGSEAELQNVCWK